MCVCVCVCVCVIWTPRKKRGGLGPSLGRSVTTKRYTLLSTSGVKSTDRARVHLYKTLCFRIDKTTI